MTGSLSSNTNKCSFTCPVTGQSEQVAICAFKRNRVYRGKSSGTSVCTCAIHAGKCVITRVMQSPEEKLQQHFTSTTEKSVKVPDELAKTVAAIIVPTELLNRFVDIDEHDMERLTSVTPREGKKGKK